MSPSVQETISFETYDRSVASDLAEVDDLLASFQGALATALGKVEETVEAVGAKVEDVKEEVEGSALQTENAELGEPLDKFESALTAAKIKGAPAHPSREDIDDGDVAQTLAGLAKVVPTSQWASIQIKDGCVVGVTLRLCARTWGLHTTSGPRTRTKPKQHRAPAPRAPALLALPNLH